MNTDESVKLPANVLHDFVPADYPQRKREILINGLVSLRNIHRQREFEDWRMLLAAFELITQEVCAELNEPDFRAVLTKKGTPFQKRFQPRWERYEALLPGNYKPLSRSERGNLRELVRHPEILEWRTTLAENKQRGMTHPNRLVTAWKASQRDQKDPDAAEESPTDRIIKDLDQRIEDDAKLIDKLKSVIDEHEWNSNEAIGEIITTLAFKMRNQSIHERVTTTEKLLRALGWNEPTLDSINRIFKGSKPQSGKSRKQAASGGKRGLVWKALKRNPPLPSGQVPYEARCRNGSYYAISPLIAFDDPETFTGYHVAFYPTATSDVTQALKLGQTPDLDEAKWFAERHYAAAR
jgi:hypothetical protein